MSVPCDYKVLLYYKYVSLEDPEEVRDWQRSICDELGIKGRILVSDEGINGTCAGLAADIDEYVRRTEERVEFVDMEWKESGADEQVFPKLKVKVRPEIVTLGERKQGHDVHLENKAHYIEPEELLALYESDKEFVILDARNEYEAEIGKFKNAMIPPIDNFREFPAFAKTIEGYKDKTVVTYCTGGIRCEKASAYLRENGFENVRQLHGGVHVYAEKTGGKHFEGELFVFDKRLHMPVNHVNPTTIAVCKFCESKVTRLVDCAEYSCGELFVACEACEKEMRGTCSQRCKQRVLSSKCVVNA